MTALWRLRARRRRGERGAALVEMILFTPLLVMIAIGILEFGLAWRDSITIASTTRAGARVGSNAGNDRMADYNTLLAVQAAVASIPNAQINKVVIYRSTTTDGAVPPNCTTSATGINSGSVRCNVYTGAQLATLSTSNFATTGTSCSAAAWDRFWCPLDRQSQQSAGADYLGVWISVSHPWVTRMFPGSGLTITDHAVMRLEPSI
ncbi:MAG: pilus assembly protein [Acidimicrobiales bacterium]|nr:pilus assembly protein [Acidimicrobiales bacterium]